MHPRYPETNKSYCLERLLKDPNFKLANSTIRKLYGKKKTLYGSYTGAIRTILKQFFTAPYGLRPISKHVVFNECLTQNTNFRPRHMAQGWSPNNWFLINASHRIPLLGPAIWPQADP